MAMLFECFISETTFATQANDTKNITNVGSEQSQTAVINSSVLLIVFFLSLSNHRRNEHSNCPPPETRIRGMGTLHDNL